MAALVEIAQGSEAVASQLNTVIRAANGTASAGVSWLFTGHNSASEWALSVRNLDATNSQALLVRKHDDTVLLQVDKNNVQVAVGSAAAPGLTFVGDSDTGFMRSSANKIGVVTGGIEIARFDLNSGSMGSFFLGGALSAQTLTDIYIDGPNAKYRGRAASFDDGDNPAQFNGNRYNANSPYYTPLNTTVAPGTIVAHGHLGAAIQDLGGAGVPSAAPVARWFGATHAWSAQLSNNNPGIIGWQVVGTGSTLALGGYSGGSMYLASGSSSTGSGFVVVNKGFSPSLPAPSWTFDINSNPGSNTTAQVLRLTNGDDPASGETGQQVVFTMAMRGTSDGGSTFSDVSAINIKATKTGDFFNASGNADDDARLIFETVQNGAMTEALRLENGGAQVANGLTVTAGGATVTAGGLTVSAGGLTVSAGTITLNGPIAAADPPAANQLTQMSFAKAWMAFSVSAGAPSSASGANYNTTGILDNGVGDYSILFDRAMANADYAVCAMASDTCYMSLADRGTSSVRLRQYDASGTLTDGPGGGVQSVAVFGAQ